VSARGFVVAATGLRAEARIAERSPNVKAIAGGGDEARLAASIEREIANGARGLISFGIAGALQPGLAAGACIVGTAVVCDGQKFETDAAWREGLIAALPGVQSAEIFGSPRAIGDVRGKAALHRKTGAAVVDMESHIVAHIAAEHRLPLAVLRVVADSADLALPPAALNGMKPDGTPDVVAVLRSLGAQPWQLPDLMRTAFAARRAMAGLLRCHRLLGTGLGFVDLS
jgi:hopanoid-associated phosphorylase